jgi:hypothetical protein
VGREGAVRRIAVHFNEEITQGEIMQILRDAGLHMRSESGVRLVVDRVPSFLRHDEATVLRLPTRARKVAR